MGRHPLAHEVAAEAIGAVLVEISRLERNLSHDADTDLGQRFRDWMDHQETTAWAINPNSSISRLRTGRAIPADGVNFALSSVTASTLNDA